MSEEQTCGNCDNMVGQIFMWFMKAYFCKYLKSQTVDKNNKCKFKPSRWKERGRHDVL